MLGDQWRVHFTPKLVAPPVVEPPDDVKGDAARVWFYISETYKIKLSSDERKMFEEWSKADPPDAWERLRDARVEAAQGNHNPFVVK